MKTEKFFRYAKNSRISGTNPSLNKTTSKLLYSGALAPLGGKLLSAFFSFFFTTFHNYLRTGASTKAESFLYLSDKSRCRFQV